MPWKLSNPSCHLCHDSIEGACDDSGLQFEEKSFGRDGMDVLWHLSVEEAKSGFDLLFDCLIEVDISLPSVQTVSRVVIYAASARKCAKFWSPRKAKGPNA